MRGKGAECFSWKLFLARHYKQKRCLVAEIFWSLNLLMISFEIPIQWLFWVQIGCPSTLFQIVHWKSIVYEFPGFSLCYNLLFPFLEIFFLHGSNCLKAHIGYLLVPSNWIPVWKISRHSSEIHVLE